MTLLALPQELKDHIFSCYVSNEDPRRAVRTRLVCRMYSSFALSIAQPLSPPIGRRALCKTGDSLSSGTIEDGYSAYWTLFGFTVSQLDPSDCFGVRSEATRDCVFIYELMRNRHFCQWNFAAVAPPSCLYGLDESGDLKG
jgi:hypothetical protein